MRVRFEPTEAEKQLQAREVLEKALNPNREDPAYVVALDLTEHPAVVDQGAADVSRP